MVAPEISQGGNFSYDENGDFYATTKIYGYIKKDEIKEGYRFWLGILNSRLFWFFIQETGYILRGGYFAFKTNYVLPFPVPSDIPYNTFLQIERLVSEILQKRKDSSEVEIAEQENEINNLVYSLYKLSNEEIEAINRLAKI